MRVIVCGSRDWNDAVTILEALYDLDLVYHDITVIHGDAAGADRCAAWAARRLGLTVESYPADWKTHGKRAGHIRNKQMLDSGCDVLLAFKDGFDSTPGRGGTENMVKIAGAAGVEVRIIQHTKEST